MLVNLSMSWIFSRPCTHRNMLHCLRHHEAVYSALSDYPIPRVQTASKALYHLKEVGAAPAQVALLQPCLHRKGVVDVHLHQCLQRAGRTETLTLFNLLLKMSNSQRIAPSYTCRALRSDIEMQITETYIQASWA